MEDSNKHLPHHTGGVVMIFIPLGTGHDRAPIVCWNSMSLAPPPPIVPPSGAAYDTDCGLCGCVMVVLVLWSL